MLAKVFTPKQRIFMTVLLLLLLSLGLKTEKRDDKYGKEVQQLFLLLMLLIPIKDLQFTLVGDEINNNNLQTTA
jgi:hypothetical protein